MLFFSDKGLKRKIAKVDHEAREKKNKQEYCAEYKTMQDFLKSNATTCLHKWKIFLKVKLF